MNLSVAYRIEKLLKQTQQANEKDLVSSQLCKMAIDAIGGDELYLNVTEGALKFLLKEKIIRKSKLLTSLLLLLNNPRFLTMLLRMVSNSWKS